MATFEREFVLAFYTCSGSHEDTEVATRFSVWDKPAGPWTLDFGIDVYGLAFLSSGRISAALGGTLGVVLRAWIPCIW